MDYLDEWSVLSGLSGRLCALDEHTMKAPPKQKLPSFKRRGVMIALWPSPQVAVELSHWGNEPAGDLHMTLAFLGYEDEIPDGGIDAVREILEELAKHPPLAARIAGLGRFSASESSDAKDVIWASVDAPDLPSFRQALVDTLDDLGVPASKAHGYTPHITLSYIDPQAKTQIDHFKPIETSFDRLVLAVGTQRYEYRLGS